VLTGVEHLERKQSAMVHIDYITGVIDCDDRLDVEKKLAFVGQAARSDVRLDWQRPIYRGRRWDASGTGTDGTMAAATDSRDGGKPSLWISIPGKPLSAMNEHEQREILRYLWAIGMRMTRLDVALDVPHDAVTHLQLDTALEYAEVVGPRSYRSIKSRQKGVDGWAVYIGGDGSDTQLCVYDKRAESGGEVDSIRWELHCRDERARVTLEYLMQFKDASSDDWCQAQAALVTSWVDFRVAAPGKRIHERNRLNWWQDIVSLARDDVWPALARPIRSLQDTLQWLHHQVIHTIEMVRGACKVGGNELLVELLYSRFDYRLTRCQRDKIERWKRELSAGLVSPCGELLTAMAS
jgi:hypothetical protein